MTMPDGSGTTSANGGQATPVFTQDQVNHFVANGKRSALDGYFKEVGLDKTPTPEEFKSLLTAANEHQKQQQGQRGDVERLTSELAAEKEKSAKVSTLEAELLRARIAGDAGLKSRYHKYVEGDTKEDIEASVKEVLSDVGGGGTGSGSGGDEAGKGGDGNGAPEDQSQRQQATGSLEPNLQQGTGVGGAKKPKATLAAGAAAYAAKHEKKE